MKKNDEPDIVAVLAQVIKNPDDLAHCFVLLESARIAYKKCVKPFIRELETFLKNKKCKAIDIEHLINSR